MYADIASVVSRDVMAADHPSPILPGDFFFNDPATTEIYTLSLHDALPISTFPRGVPHVLRYQCTPRRMWRSEEHTSELQSRENLVCRLLLEKKKNPNHLYHHTTPLRYHPHPHHVHPPTPDRPTSTPLPHIG